MDKHRWKAGGGALKALAVALLVAACTMAGAQAGNARGAAADQRTDAPEMDGWRPHIQEASARFGIPEEWIRRVMRAESGGRTMLHGRPITSRAGARGLMQLMPGTWAEMRAEHRLGPDPHDPRENILAGTAYLRAMYDRFGYPGLFAAYNAGPGRYARHIQSGVALPSETLAYMAQVAPDASRPNVGFRRRARAGSSAPAAISRELFAVRREASHASEQVAPSIAATLFAIGPR